MEIKITVSELDLDILKIIAKERGWAVEDVAKEALEDYVNTATYDRIVEPWKARLKI